MFVYRLPPPLSLPFPRYFPKQRACSQANPIVAFLFYFRQKLEQEKVAREKAEAERKRLEEEIAQLKASQEKQARGCHNLCSLLLSFMIIFYASYSNLQL